MAVFRVERNKGYTVMSNHYLRNKEITLKAKGLLSQMLSLPEDWDYTLAGYPRASFMALPKALKSYLIFSCFILFHPTTFYCSYFLLDMITHSI